MARKEEWQHAANEILVELLASDAGRGRVCYEYVEITFIWMTLKMISVHQFHISRRRYVRVVSSQNDTNTEESRCRQRNDAIGGHSRLIWTTVWLNRLRPASDRKTLFTLRRFHSELERARRTRRDVRSVIALLSADLLHRLHRHPHTTYDRTSVSKGIRWRECLRTRPRRFQSSGWFSNVYCNRGPLDPQGSRAKDSVKHRPRRLSYVEELSQSE